MANTRFSREWWSDVGAVALVIGLLGIMVAAVVWIHYGFVSDFLRQRRLHAEGVETVGEIVEVYRSTGGRNYSLSVTYRYTVDAGREWVVERRADETVTALYEAGDPVTVLYLPDEPEVSDVAVSDAGPVGIGMMVIFDVLLVLVGIGVWREGRRESRNTSLN